VRSSYLVLWVAAPHALFDGFGDRPELCMVTGNAGGISTTPQTSCFRMIAKIPAITRMTATIHKIVRVDVPGVVGYPVRVWPYGFRS